MPLHLSLPQTSPHDGDPYTRTPEEIAAWLPTLPRDRPADAARAVIEALVALNRTRVRITLRQEITELLRAAADDLIPHLGDALASATVPLSTSSRSAASLAEELLTELAYSYKLLLVEQSRRLFGFASSGRALLPVLRAMEVLARRLEVGYRTYATNPKGVWSELHELYQFGLRRGLAQRSLDGGTSTPLSVYRNALLLAYAEPLKLMQGDLDRVIRWIHRFGERASIGPSQQNRGAQGLFLVKAQRDVPGYALSKRHHPVPQPHDLVLNTLPLAELLLDQVSRLSAGEIAESLDLPDGGDAFRDLMGRLIKHWGAVPNRRFTRLRTHARVEIRVGIRGIWDFLNNGAAARSSTGEWMVTNESPRGFALMHVSGPIDSIRVGEVIGLRTRESDTCHVCVVRWVLSDNPEHLELGLEELAPTARPVSIRRSPAGKLEGEGEPVLLLPEVPSLNQAPAILAPLAVLDSTCELNLGELQSKLRVRATRLLERTVSVQVVQFSAVS
jgi:hypothetical protein